MGRDVLRMAPPLPTTMTTRPPRWSIPSDDTSLPLLARHDHHRHHHHADSIRSSSLALDRELEMDLEASDTTLRRHEEAALRVSEHQNPFSSSRLQPFHQLSEQNVALAMQLFRMRATRQKQFLDARQAAHLTTKPTTSGVSPVGFDAPSKLVKEQADIRVYRHATRRGKTTPMMAQGLVRGSLAEVLDGLYAETTKEARVLYPLLSNAFVDVSVLHVDSYRTAQHPFQFAGVTRMALETPRGGWGVCKDRDFVCFKKMGLLKDPESTNSDDVGFLTLLSVDQPRDASATASFVHGGQGNASSAASAAAQYAASTAGPDFVRGFVSLTAFFKQLPNGLVSMFVQGDFNARGHLAARLADHMFAELVFALGNAAKCGQAKSLAMLLQSISAGQLPPGGLAASASGSHVSHLLPLLSEKNRDRCGVCAKTLWRVLESPEFCRSCWLRTCRNCHVTMPIYCADFHRAHDDDGSAIAGGGNGGGGSASGSSKKRFKRLPKPCKETFCLKCVCSVLPNGIKMNAKLLKQTAKKKKYTKKHGGTGSMVTDPSLLRRGIGRTAASARHVPSAGLSTSSRVSKSGYRHGSGSGGNRDVGGGSSRNGREPGKLYVQIPRPHHHQLHRRATGSNVGTKPTAATGVAGAGTAPAVSKPLPRHFDDHSSISALSSVESEKLQRQRLSLNKSNGPKPSVTQQEPSQSNTKPPAPPTSMLDVLEKYQLSQLTTTMSADCDYSEPLNDDDNQSALALSYNSYSTTDSVGGGAIYPADHAVASSSSSYAAPAPHATTRKPLLQVRVSLTPRKRARRSSTASSRNGSVGAGSQNSSKRTNYASSVRHSPQFSSTGGHAPAFDDAYYNHALQRYLEKRRTSLGLSTSTTMSMDLFESLDKASAEATARAAAAGGSGAGIQADHTAHAAESHSSGSLDDSRRRRAGSSDAHKLRILRDLEPFPRTPSFLDRPLTPSRLSMSSLSSHHFSSSSETSSGAAAAAHDRSTSSFDPPSSQKRSNSDWAAAY